MDVKPVFYLVFVRGISADVSQGFGFLPLLVIELLSLVHSEFQNQYQLSKKVSPFKKIHQYQLSKKFTLMWGQSIYAKNCLDNFAQYLSLKRSFVLSKVSRTCISYAAIPHNMQVSYPE